MVEQAILITGSSGEVGVGLLQHLAGQQSEKIVAVDLREGQHPLPKNAVFIKGNVTDQSLWADLAERYDFVKIFHLAGILSTGAEKNPELAHEVNAQASVKLIALARVQSEKRGSPTKFIFPSTIAVYGISSSEIKNQSGKVREDQFLSPITIYGSNKLYVENIGRYYTRHYKLLEDRTDNKIDFRAVRFPGLLSSETLPTGGTSDYGAEILHAAAKGVPYNCFVKPETTLPFMAMPDAVRALIELTQAPKERLTQLVYNVGAFSVSAAGILAETSKHFPDAKVDYVIDKKRHSIVETWPMDVDDSAASRDWGWRAKYNLESAFTEYLVPGVLRRYGLMDKAASF